MFIDDDTDGPTTSDKDDNEYEDIGDVADHKETLHAIHDASTSENGDSYFTDDSYDNSIQETWRLGERLDVQSCDERSGAWSGEGRWL